MPEITTAERAGVGRDGLPRPTEDRVVLLPNAVVLLDGATSPTPRERDGGWHSRHLAAELARLDADDRADLRAPAEPHDLADVLARAIARLAAAHGLAPGDSPSSTVAITRWTDTAVDVLVLADSPVVVFTDAGVEVVADNRLRDLRGKVDRITDWRNREDGWWVAEAEPAAAHRAVRASWPRDRVRAVLMATDGVSCGVDDYGLFEDWRAVLRITSEKGPEAVLDEIRAAEAGDADRMKWPRPKVHDDQALAVIRFIAGK
ncbi:protein phosphatase 2C domain-containing protein [Saccharothrix sp. 6-C]|uniref:protein phosphatase 2C domain-containing protein n=1 Tax=Saccharothrix sp. 6-C TaxID=2781735 RepID=UPI0019178367|nr:protein phosphatase 2C domain-containing protein [Saccharothrix sp. 6-C]QQQ76148.1 protein phosphatase 2C domain-containing protein [Saccharothrix sp. 6-C]